VNLLEIGKNKIVLTGSKKTLLALVGDLFGNKFQKLFFLSQSNADF